MSDEVFVDASEPVVFSDDAPLAFFKSTVPSTWLYAARAGRLARDGDKYRFVLVRNRKHESGSSGGLELVTKGGTLATQVNMAALIGNEQDERAWTDAIKRNSPFIPPGTDRLSFRPLGLRNGKMSFAGLETLVDDPSRYINIPIGSPTSVPVTLPLTANGADELWSVLEAGAGFPFSIRFDYDYDVLYPGAHYVITANTEKTWKFFSVNAKARASYFGLVGAEADVTVIRQQLIGSGAVQIQWIAKPEGFDEAHVAALQNSILDAFAKSALDLMVDKVVPDTEAPEPSGFFGGVSVKMKDLEEVKSLNLSGEYKENILRTQNFSFSLSFAQLRNLDPHTYGVDVTGDNMIPITINLGKDGQHVRMYSAQYGYTRPNGTVQSDRAQATGQDGLMLKGVVQWDPHDPRPEKTELQFGVDWENLDWEDYATKKVIANGDSGVLFEFTPGTYVKRVAFLSDFPRQAPGSFASLEWRTILPPNPDGSQPKNYSGGIVYEGSGPTSLPDKFTVEFPYNNETVKDAKFEWNALFVTEDGSTFGKTQTENVESASSILAVKALMKPIAPDAIVGPRFTAVRTLMKRRAMAELPSAKSTADEYKVHVKTPEKVK